jgi:hypothetical protein
VVKTIAHPVNRIEPQFRPFPKQMRGNAVAEFLNTTRSSLSGISSNSQLASLLNNRKTDLKLWISMGISGCEGGRIQCSRVKGETGAAFLLPCSVLQRLAMRMRVFKGNASSMGRWPSVLLQKMPTCCSTVFRRRTPSAGRFTESPFMTSCQ